MIEIEVKRKESVSEGAVATIAEAFAEWLDSEGFTVNKEEDVRDFKELSQAFVEDWG